MLFVAEGKEVPLKLDIHTCGGLPPAHKAAFTAVSIAMDYDGNDVEFDNL